MGVVIPNFTKPIMDDELAIQLWELVMAGEIGSARYQQLDAEISRSRQAMPRREATAGRPWR